jgi:hypothetical protein
LNSHSKFASAKQHVRENCIGGECFIRDDGEAISDMVVARIHDIYLN